MSFEMTIDIVDVGEVSEDARGYRAQRKAIVSGMTGAGSAKLYRALTSGIVQTSAGERMPRYGDPHPAVPGIICIGRTARLNNDKGHCEVYLDYGVPDVLTSDPSDTAPPQIEVGATVIEVDTARDVAGAIMAVNYTIEDPPGTFKTVKQTGTVRKQIPSVYFRYRRREPNSPGNKAKIHVGTMNETDVFNDPPKFWLCTGITGTSSDNGASYDVTYEFLRNDETWDAVVAYHDPTTGRIPTDVIFPSSQQTFPGGLARFVVYRTTNFYDLNI